MTINPPPAESLIYDTTKRRGIPASEAAAKMDERWLDDNGCLQTTLDWIAAYRTLTAEVERLRGELATLNAWVQYTSIHPDEHVAYLRFVRHDGRASTLRTCDSDEPGAFRVYRRPAEAQLAQRDAEATRTDCYVSGCQCEGSYHNQPATSPPAEAPAPAVRYWTDGELLWAINHNGCVCFGTDGRCWKSNCNAEELDRTSCGIVRTDFPAALALLADRPEQQARLRSMAPAKEGG